MNIAVRYYTRSGNTEKLAGAIARGVGITAQPISAPLAEKVDVLFLGCSYYAFDMDEQVKAFLKDNKDNITKVVCFGSSAMMKSMLKPLKKVTDELGIEVSDKEFHCRGSFGVMHKGRPNAEDLKAAEEFARGIVE